MDTNAASKQRDQIMASAFIVGCFLVASSSILAIILGGTPPPWIFVLALLGCVLSAPLAFSLVLKSRETAPPYHPKLINAISKGILILDRQTRHILHANQIALQIMERPLDQLRGHNVCSFFTTPTGDPCCTGGLHPSASGTVLHLKMPDGSHRCVKRDTSSVMLDNTEYLLDCIEDVTSEIASLQHLRQLSEVVKQCATTVVITDKEGVIEYVNPRFTEVTGFTPEEILGKKPNLLRSGNTPKSYYEDLWKTLIEGKPWKGEFENCKKNGSIFWEMASITPMFNNRGHITHFVAVKEDITPRKRMEEELHQAHAELQEINSSLMETVAEKNEILSIVAHDLRNPLCSVLGLAELIANGMARDKAVDFAERIVASTNHAVGLLNNLLSIQVIESGKASLTTTPIPLIDVIKYTLEIMTPKAQAKSIRIKHNFRDSCYVTGDLMALRQVFENLVSNAIKFSPLGSEISLENYRHEGKAIVSVADRGPGIGPDDQAKLFKKFARLSARPTNNESSTGLGLAIVKRYVDAMGGEISCDSTLGDGTTFTVSFPELSDPVKLS